MVRWLNEISTERSRDKEEAKMNSFFKNRFAHGIEP